MPPDARATTPPDAPSPVLATLYLYDESGLVERRCELGSIRSLLESARAEGRRVWVDIESADRLHMASQLAAQLDLHPLSVDVLVSHRHRTSVDEFPSSGHLSSGHLSSEQLFSHIIMEIVHVKHVLGFEKVDFLLGPDWLVTVQDQPGDCFDPVRRRLREEPAFRARPTSSLFHAVGRAVCDSYHAVLAPFGQRLEHLESRLISRPSAGLIHRIHAAKRDLRGLRRAVVPLRESIETLFYANRRWPGASEAGSSANIELSLALRELHDELGGVLDVLDAYRDAAQNLTDLYVTSASNRVNEILRVLTIISTIFIPLSFVAGVYGMNFDHMPELRWRYGYALALGLMAIIAAVLLVYFARKGWLRKSDVPRVPSITRATAFFDELKRL
jgi:magnesium transporter